MIIATARRVNISNQVKSLDSFNRTFPSFILRWRYGQREVDDPNNISSKEEFEEWLHDLEEDDKEGDDLRRLLHQNDQHKDLDEVDGRMAEAEEERGMFSRARLMRSTSRESVVDI